MSDEHDAFLIWKLSARQEIDDFRKERNALRAENAKLRKLVEHLQPIDCEGNVLDIADTVSMLRSEYDGDHEWDDVVVELALTKWGGDRWIVRGSKGEAWACDCLKTGYDEDAYEGSDDAEPIVNPSLIEVENAKLRELCRDMCRVMIMCDDSKCPYGSECIDNIVNQGKAMHDCKLKRLMRELGIEVPDA